MIIWRFCISFFQDEIVSKGIAYTTDHRPLDKKHILWEQSWSEEYHSVSRWPNSKSEFVCIIQRETSLSAWNIVVWRRVNQSDDLRFLIVKLNIAAHFTSVNLFKNVIKCGGWTSGHASKAYHRCIQRISSLSHKI